MKNISICMILVMLFSVNFKSVCVGEGGGKDQQDTEQGTKQRDCNEETKDLLDDEERTKKSDAEHLTIDGEQMRAEDSCKKIYSYSNNDYRFHNRYNYLKYCDLEDGLGEALNNEILRRESYYEGDYFYSERDVERNYEQCSCCIIS